MTHRSSAVYSSRACFLVPTWAHREGNGASFPFFKFERRVAPIAGGMPYITNNLTRSAQRLLAAGTIEIVRALGLIYHRLTIRHRAVAICTAPHISHAGEHLPLALCDTVRTRPTN